MSGTLIEWNVKGGSKSRSTLQVFSLVTYDDPRFIPLSVQCKFD